MNWKQVISDLEAIGMTQAEIGKAVDCSQPYISDLKKGSRGVRISFEIGTKLKALWKDRCQGEETRKARARKTVE